ncbi:Something about silencing protein 10 [Trichinella pseudospiralis]|uniref:Something about silencing protein 10 n=1 Tax=Trichinella pseudospiralis TaxID=6337 RepID=A0A0V1E003_TRIPS|nr:Something about silencing protein 10 [Trichinella pseudospiralis]KRZ30334.1 Something about silencing protein 10 [Trichinella pseudospiralis]
MILPYISSRLSKYACASTVYSTENAMRRKSKNALNYTRRRLKQQAVKNAKKIDPSDESDDSWINDDVDRFHNKRNKLDIELSGDENEDFASEEEASYPSSDDDEEDENLEEESDYDANQMEIASDDDFNSDIESSEEDYLPNRDAWGKKRSTFYNTDYAGDEHEGFDSSEEEPAELEEIEAKSLQRSLNEWIQGSAFTLPRQALQVRDAKTDTAVGETVDSSVTKIDMDLSTLTNDEKFEILGKQSPLLVMLLKEYKEKVKLNRLFQKFCGLLNLKSELPNVLAVAYKILEANANYIMNITFYIWLHLKNASVDDRHPVVNRIVQWRKCLNIAYKKWNTFEEDIEKILSNLEKGQSPSDAASNVDLQLRQHNQNAEEISTVNNDRDSMTDDLKIEEQTNQTEQSDTIHNEFGKRSITYEMEKNKGLMPKRKKEQRNPRVRHRNRYRKALKKRRSQIPDVKREIHRYGGEARGLNPYIVRSVKLH